LFRLACTCIDRTQMREIAVGVGILIFLILILVVYFLPAIVAHKRDSVSFGAIFVLNLLAGATGVFWFVALVWACFGATRLPPLPPRGHWVSPSTFAALAARAARRK
jgi:Superinfection immunity protein